MFHWVEQEEQYAMNIQVKNDSTTLSGSKGAICKKQ